MSSWLWSSEGNGMGSVGNSSMELPVWTWLDLWAAVSISSSFICAWVVDQRLAVELGLLLSLWVWVELCCRLDGLRLYFAILSEHSVTVQVACDESSLLPTTLVVPDLVVLLGETYDKWIHNFDNFQLISGFENLLSINILWLHYWKIKRDNKWI